MARYGQGPVLQAGPYEGYTMEDILEQDPAYLLEYMDKYDYYDNDLRARIHAKLNDTREEDFGFTDDL